VREKAFVVNLEAIKMIVTQDQARAASLYAPAPANPGRLPDGLAAATRHCTLASHSPALAVAARCSPGARAGARAERAGALAPR